MMEKDKKLAQDVKDATSALNEAITAAYEAGLDVEVREVPNHPFSRYRPCPHLSLHVSRPL